MSTSVARARALVAAILLSVPVGAQEFGPWQVLGPFDHPRGANDVAHEQDVERLLPKMRPGRGELDLGGRFAGKLGRIEWQPLAAASTALDVGVIELAAALAVPADARAGWSDNAVAYLYRSIDVEAPLPLAVSCGSDDGMRLWLNGELLVDVAVPRALNPGANAIELLLEPGRNHLLVKVANGGGGWGFRMKARSPGPIDEASIEAAIAGGVGHLLATQLVDGSWAENPEYHAGATAYAAYALLHSGLAADDPALERARAYVLAHPSPYTYSTACELLFLGKLGRPEDRQSLQERLEKLLGFQQKSGLFGYPRHPDGHVAEDLSTTLFASLAMRGAIAYGLSVPDKTWRAAVEGALSLFDGITAAEVSAGEGAGFRYRMDHPVTGSMSTGGITILSIAREALGGKFPGRSQRDAEQALEAALRWLVGRMEWSENPGQGSSHHFFWLYGVERVGDLLGLDELGGVAWYPEGARFLVDGQAETGSWGSTVHTILALLFLERASRPVHSGESSRADAWHTADELAEVRIAATGGRFVSAWVQGFRRERLQELAWPEALGGGLRVERVEFLATRAAGGAEHLLGRLELDPARPASSQSLAVRGVLPARGGWRLHARVLALRPPVSGETGSGAPTIELASPPLDIALRDVLHLEQCDYAEQGITNLLRTCEARCEASSEAAGQAAAQALDGRQATAWQFAADDKSPWLEIQLGRAQKPRRIALSHADPRLESGSVPRVARVALAWDGGQPLELDLPDDPLRKGIAELPASTRMKRIEIRVLAVYRAALGEVSSGLAEVELLP